VGSLTGLAQGKDFSMWLARTHMPSTSDHFAITHDNATHTRVRRRGVKTALGETQGLSHGRVILRRECH
jgi:hypothetical protein